MKRVQIAQGWQLCRMEARESSSWEALEAAFAGGPSAGEVFDLSEFPAQVHDVLLDRGVIENPNIRGRNEDLCEVRRCRQRRMLRQLRVHSVDGF